MTGISGALATVAAGCGLAVVWGKKGLANRVIQVVHIKALSDTERTFVFNY